jgi:hypothetical protein
MDSEEDLGLCSGMKAVIDALNVVYDEKEKRGFIKLNLVSLAFTIVSSRGLPSGFPHRKRRAA